MKYDKTFSIPRALRCISGELRGFSVIMKDGDEIIIGRDPSIADIVVNDKKISRKHCMIMYSIMDDMFYIIDYSKNGVAIENNEKIEKGIKTQLPSGTRIFLSEETIFKVN